MGKYSETRKRAKRIADLSNTSRLILMGVQRLHDKEGSEESDKFLAGCEHARLYLIEVLEDEGYPEADPKLTEAKEKPLTTLEECKDYGEFMYAMYNEVKEKAKISALFYPFIMSITTLEVIIFFVAAISLYVFF